MWNGLPADSELTPADVLARVQECTGLDSGPAERTATQQRNLDDILAVTRTPERSLETNMLYASFLFQDIVSKRLDGRNPFNNRSGHLVQTFTTEAEHGELSNAEYANSISALDTWVRTGRRPTPQSIAKPCAAFDRTYDSGCFYDPSFSPSPYASKIRPRDGNIRWPAMTAAQERAWSRVDGVGIAP